MSLSVQDWRHLLGYGASLVLIVLGYVLGRQELVGAGCALSTLAARASALRELDDARRERDDVRRERDDLAAAIDELDDAPKVRARVPRRVRDTLDRCNKRKGP